MRRGFLNRASLSAKACEAFPQQDHFLSPAAMDRWLQFLGLLGRDLHRLLAAFGRALKLKLKLGMLLQQILKQPKRPGTAALA